MQEFLTNNTVSCNLMSLTGYRTLVILEALLESPKTNDEINDYLLQNKYIGEKFSSDTLRLYLNSLRAVGCEIERAKKSNNQRYELTSHPFAYEISQSQLNAIAGAYKNIYAKIEIDEVIALENLFKKLSNEVQNPSVKEYLLGLCYFKNIDENLLKDILFCCKKKSQIKFLYNSPKNGETLIEIVADKISLKNEKVYLWGSNLTHKEYSFFLVNRIKKICEEKLHKTDDIFLPQIVVYEVYNSHNYALDKNERIVEKFDDKLIIEAEVRNEFSFLQKILYQANNCKILEPESLKKKILTRLKNMEIFYE